MCSLPIEETPALPASSTENEQKGDTTAHIKIKLKKRRYKRKVRSQSLSDQKDLEAKQQRVQQDHSTDDLWEVKTQVAEGEDEVFEVADENDNMVTATSENSTDILLQSMVESDLTQVTLSSQSLDNLGDDI